MIWVFYLVISRFVATIVYLITIIWEDGALRKMPLIDFEYYVFVNHGAAKSVKFEYFFFCPK